MKKFIITIITLFVCLIGYAQKDTLVLKDTASITFFEEQSINKAGKIRIEYFAEYDGEIYMSNKQSVVRHKVYQRFNRKPIYAIIIDRKSKATKLIVL